MQVQPRFAPLQERETLDGERERAREREFVRERKRKKEGRRERYLRERERGRRGGREREEVREGGIESSSSRDPPPQANSERDLIQVLLACPPLTALRGGYVLSELSYGGPRGGSCFL